MKIFGLIGYPLSHSFSALYFSEKFSRENISGCEYRLFPLQQIADLTKLIEETDGIRGLNVTIPYKRTVIPLLDELSPEAEASGAVNTIKIDFRDGKNILKGYNTDIRGFEKACTPLLLPTDISALVMGTGGASCAVTFVLEKLGVQYKLVSRVSGRADYCYEDIDKRIIKNCSLIINCTPLGMYPDVASYPELPYEALTPDHMVFDLVYNPPVTSLMKKAMERGCRVTNGLEMLHLQAEESWRLWNNL